MIESSVAKYVLLMSVMFVTIFIDSTIWLFFLIFVVLCCLITSEFMYVIVEGVI